VTSLDRPVSTEDDAATLAQFLPHEAPGPEEHLTLALTQEKLRAAVRTLPDDERRIIELRFGVDGEAQPLTVKEIARKLGITARRVQSLEASGLERLSLNREIQALREAA
jgi:RNA polymerase primary sigma factor